MLLEQICHGDYGDIIVISPSKKEPQSRVYVHIATILSNSGDTECCQTAVVCFLYANSPIFQRGLLAPVDSSGSTLHDRPVAN